jgi:hypothetical protein
MKSVAQNSQHHNYDSDDDFRAYLRTIPSPDLEWIEATLFGFHRAWYVVRKERRRRRAKEGEKALRGYRRQERQL